jgi:ferredoxin
MPDITDKDRMLAREIIYGCDGVEQVATRLASEREAEEAKRRELVEALTEATVSICAMCKRLNSQHAGCTGCSVLVWACKALHALLPEAPQEPAPTPEGETVMRLRVDGCWSEWYCTQCGRVASHDVSDWHPGYSYCPGCGRKIKEWRR